jgi:hypothetical protein
VDLSLFKEFEKRQKAKKEAEAEAKKNGVVGVENLAIVGSDGN